MEDIVALIQSGHHDLIEKLWFQVRDLIAWYAVRYLRTITTTAGTTLGSVEKDDLVQSGYIALHDAVNGYDPSKGSFTNYLSYHIRKEFRKAIGRSDRQLADPLNGCRSLDEPLNDDTDTTLLEYVSESTIDQHDDYSVVEDKVFIEQLHDALERALNTLPEKQAQAIRCEYWNGKTLEQTADEIGVSPERVRQLRNSGLNRIRKSSSCKELEQFLDDNTNFYKGDGLAMHIQTNSSGVERKFFHREYLRSKYKYLFSDQDSRNVKR